MMLVFQESNFYNALATVYFDLVVFGTAVLLIYEDYDNVIVCFNPAFGEYYVDNDPTFRPVVFAREFTYTIQQTVERWGLENCSESVRRTYELPNGAGLTQEIIIAHVIEPNKGPHKFAFPDKFAFREFYWEWGGSASNQGASQAQCLLEKYG